MPSISEYAGLAGHQRPTLHAPANLGEIARWLGLLLGAYLAIRLLLLLMRGPARR